MKKNCKNNKQKKYRLFYWYANCKGLSYTIPVSSIYEAALVKYNLAFSDLIKYEKDITEDFTNVICLEVYEDDEWVKWYDENDNDNIEEWLKENEPDNFVKIYKLKQHCQAIREFGRDITLDDEEDDEE